MKSLRTWSVPLGRIFGTDVRVHLSFLLLAFYVMAAAIEMQRGGGAVKGLILLAGIFFSLIAHELGHLMVANVKGMTPRLIMLLPLGGVHLRDPAPRPPSLRDEATIALAGPAVSLLIGVVLTIVILSLYPEADLGARPFIDTRYPGKSLIYVNLFLAALSLVPAYPLDGGRILRVLLVDFRAADLSASFAEATRRVVYIGQIFSVVLMFAGIVGNPTMMLVGFFLFLAVQIEDRSMLFQAVIESVRLEEIMLTDFSTLSPADTLQDALHKAVHTLQDDFPVVRGGEMVGVISKQHIIDALRNDGNGYVQSAMKRAFELGDRHDSLAAAFRKMTRGVSIIPVVDGGRLVGIVTLQNLMHSMGLLAESRRLKVPED